MKKNSIGNEDIKKTKEMSKKLVEVFEQLPEEDKQRGLGFFEGINAARKNQTTQKDAGPNDAA